MPSIEISIYPATEEHYPPLNAAEMQALLAEMLVGAPMNRANMESAAQTLRRLIVQAFDLGYGVEPPEMIHVGYDVEQLHKKISFTVYVTPDGEGMLRVMGFRDVFTMDAEAQRRLYHAMENTGATGIV